MSVMAEMMSMCRDDESWFNPLKHLFKILLTALQKDLNEGTTLKQFIYAVNMQVFTHETSMNKSLSGL